MISSSSSLASIEPGHVVEGDLRLFLAHELGPGLAELHDPVPAALHLHEDEHHEAEQEQPREEADQDLPEPGWLWVRAEGRARLADHCDEIALGTFGIAGNLIEGLRGQRRAGETALELVGARQHLHHLVVAGLDVVDELGKLDDLGALDLVEPPLGEDGQHDDGQPVNDERAHGSVH